MFKKRQWLLPLLLVSSACLARLIPHAPNFTPMLSVALFSGACFERRHFAFMVPIIAMIISDAVMGFHALVPAIYATMILIVLLGSYIRKRNISSVAFMSTVGAVLFFVLSNLAVWAFTPHYAKNMIGLSQCFALAIPFFSNTLLSTWIYCALMFGIFELFQQKKYQELVSTL